MAPTETAIFLVLTVDSGAEAVIRDLLADVSGLKRSVGFRIPEGELTCVVGLGSELSSTALTGNLFYVPGVDFLDDPPARESTQATPPDGEREDGALGIGSLKGT